MKLKDISDYELNEALSALDNVLHILNHKYMHVEHLTTGAYKKAAAEYKKLSAEETRRETQRTKY